MSSFTSPVREAEHVSFEAQIRRFLTLLPDVDYTTALFTCKDCTDVEVVPGFRNIYYCPSLGQVTHENYFQCAPEDCPFREEDTWKSELGLDWPEGSVRCDLYLPSDFLSQLAALRRDLAHSIVKKPAASTMIACAVIMCQVTEENEIVARENVYKCSLGELSKIPSWILSLSVGKLLPESAL